MAANNGEVNVKIKVDAETNGAAKVKQNLNEVGNAANNAANKSKGAFDRIKSSIGNVSKSAGALSKIFTGLGVAGLFTGAIASISKIADSFGSAKRQAEAFGKIQKDLAQEKGIAALAAQYDKLKASLAETREAQDHQLDMIDIGVQNRRRNDAAKLESDKLSALAALDPSAPDYAEQKAAIEADFASRSAAMRASNEREDLVLTRQRMSAQADALDKDADAEDAAANLVRRKLAQTKAAKSAAEIEAVDLNDADKTGFASAVGKTLGQLFTGDWGRMGEAKTADGDERRANAAKRAADLELKVQELENQLAAREKSAAAIRANAGRVREKRDAMGGMFEALDAEMANAAAEGRAGETAAENALNKKRRQLAQDDAANADAANAAMLLSSQEAALKSQIAQEQARKADAAKNVWNAKNAYDLDPSRSSLESLQKAEGAAKDVDFAADRAINALTKTLEDVSKRLQAAQAHLEKQSSQSHYAWSESPAGE